MISPYNLKFAKDYPSHLFSLHYFLFCPFSRVSLTIPSLIIFFVLVSSVSLFSSFSSSFYFYFYFYFFTIPPTFLAQILLFVFVFFGSQTSFTNLVPLLFEFSPTIRSKKTNSSFCFKTNIHPE